MITSINNYFSFVVLILFFYSPFSYGQSVNIVNCETDFEANNYYSVRIYSFDAFSEFVSSYSVNVKKDLDTDFTSFTYLFYNNFYRIPDTLKIIIYKCNSSVSFYKYTYVKVSDTHVITVDSIREGKLDFMGSSAITVNNHKYLLDKYLISTDNEQTITLYYSDTLGIIKQYGPTGEQCIELDGKEGCFEDTLVNGFLRELYFNLNFHERYDGGPRIIRATVLDKDIFKAKTKADRKSNRKSKRRN